jgi:hypothetical protein
MREDLRFESQQAAGAQRRIWRIAFLSNELDPRAVPRPVP